MLSILFMRMCRGTVSKAFMTSTADVSVRGAGLLVLRPSCIVCVMFVRRVVVECLGLKPCCVGDSGMEGFITLRTSLSRILEGFGRSEIGLYEAGCVGDLLGFRMGMILAIFQEFGIWLYVMDLLNMSVRDLIACGPKCLRCLYEMLSGPVAGEFLVERMEEMVWYAVKGGAMSVSSFMWCSCLVMLRLCGWCGR